MPNDQFNRLTIFYLFFKSLFRIKTYNIQSLSIIIGYCYNTKIPIPAASAAGAATFSYTGEPLYHLRSCRHVDHVRRVAAERFVYCF